MDFYLFAKINLPICTFVAFCGVGVLTLVLFTPPGTFLSALFPLLYRRALSLFWISIYFFINIVTNRINSLFSAPASRPVSYSYFNDTDVFFPNIP